MPTFADKPKLRGDKVVLRPIVAADADDMWADAFDDEITHFTGTHADFTREQVEAWCATRADEGDRLDLAVVDHDTGQWFGEVVINDWDPDNRTCNFRIALSANGRDRGIGTEATSMVVDYVFGEIECPLVNRIELEVYDFNQRAIAVYEKVGFRREGVRRDALLWNGDFHDAIIMSVLRRDRDRPGEHGRASAETIT